MGRSEDGAQCSSSSTSNHNLLRPPEDHNELGSDGEEEDHLSIELRDELLAGASRRLSLHHPLPSSSCPFHTLNVHLSRGSNLVARDTCGMNKNVVFLACFCS